MKPDGLTLMYLAVPLLVCGYTGLSFPHIHAKASSAALRRLRLPAEFIRTWCAAEGERFMGQVGLAFGGLLLAFGFVASI
jgi:hypothetical protein